jgi:molybdenum cofactor cytidylyltransferase
VSRTRVAAVVPAAGRSERFGGPKLVADVGGVPMVQRTLHTLVVAGVDPVVVVISAGSALEVAGPTVVPALADPAVFTVVNPDPDRGMLSSIQTGLAEVDADTILILPADMPFVRAETIAAVIAAATEHRVIVSPRFDGKRGHPIAVPGHLRGTIVDADPASNLSDVLEPEKGDRVQLDLDDPGVLRDVDRVTDIE